jgi:HEAT repeat protein
LRTLFLSTLILVGVIDPASGQDRRVIAGKDVDGWIAILRDPAKSNWDCQTAMSVLGEFGPEAKGAVPFLIERFVKLGCVHYTGTGSFGFDQSVKMALVQIGGPSVPALLEILNGPDEAMRVCAAEALGEIGPAARDAVPRLIQTVERPDDSRDGDILWRHAIDALGKIGPDAKAAVPTLMDLLGPEGDRADVGIVVALDRLGSPPSAKLVDMFVHDADDFVREGSSFTTAGLFYLGPKARAEAPRIRAILADKRPALRVEAAAILAHIDPSDPVALSVLLEALNHDPEDRARYGSLVDALTWLGPAAKAAMPGLIAWAGNDPERENLLRALVTIDPDNPSCVPLLIEALKKGDDYRIYEATVCLGVLGPRARSALPALVEVIRNRVGKRTTDDNPVWSIIESAIRAVGRIDPQSPLVISALIEVIEGATAVGKTPEPKSERGFGMLGSLQSLNPLVL